MDFGQERPARNGTAGNGTGPPQQDVDPGERPGRERQPAETMPSFPEDGPAGVAVRRAAASPATPTDSSKPARTVAATDPALDSQPDLSHRARHLPARTLHVATEPRRRPARVGDTPFPPLDGSVHTRHSAARPDDIGEAAAVRRAAGWSREGTQWEGAQWAGTQWAGLQGDGAVEDVAADRWPDLPDDSGLWVAPAPAFATDRVRRLEREQRGW